VAAVVSTASVNGSPPMTVASVQSSFGGLGYGETPKRK